MDAVRKRVQRGTIEHEKDQAGRVRIILDSPDDTSTLQDESPDTTRQPDALIAAKDETIEEQRARIAYLERQVEEEREARRRADTILAQLSAANAEQARTIRAIEAPQEAADAAETVEQEPQGGQPRPAAPGAQEGVQRPWWRRVFGR